MAPGPGQQSVAKIKYGFEDKGHSCLIVNQEAVGSNPIGTAMEPPKGVVSRLENGECCKRQCRFESVQVPPMLCLV